MYHNDALETSTEEVSVHNVTEWFFTRILMYSKILIFVINIDSIFTKCHIKLKGDSLHEEPTCFLKPDVGIFCTLSNILFKTNKLLKM